MTLTDYLDGGAGVDTVTYAGSHTGVTVDLAAGTASGNDADGDVLVAIENVIGSEGADALSGDAEANALTGKEGNDTLDGRGGDDQLDGGSGNDLILGGEGDDILTGGSGSDSLVGGLGTDMALYSGAVSDYSITFADGSAVVVDAVAGRDGVDHLINVERLRFADYEVHIDGTNNRPLTTADRLAVAEDGTLTIAASALLQNDFDLDGQIVGITSVGDAVGGTVQFDPVKGVVFRPSKVLTARRASPTPLPMTTGP